jgi:outer membrane protein, heavy metal efflux system
MRKHVRAVVLAMTVLSSDVSSAQTTREPAAPRYVDAASGISLEQAITRALDREPSLRATRADVEVARGMRLQAGLRPNPMVSVTRQEEPAGTDNQIGVNVEWALDLFRRPGRVGVADREIEVVQRAVADRERMLAADVRMKYGAVVAAVRDLTVSDELVAATARQLELVRARVDEGATPPLERDMLDVEVRRLESDRLLQEGHAHEAMIELKRALGLSPEEPLQLRYTLEQVVFQDRAALSSPEVTPEVNDRPDVQEADARVRVAEARTDRARRNGRFDVSLFGTYTRVDAGFPQRGFTGQGDLDRVRGVFHYLAGGAKLTVPVGNRNQGEIAAAEAERTGAIARREAAQLTALAEIAVARAWDGHAQRAVAIYTAGARTLARRNFDVVSQTYELGRATIFDVLAEQRRYLEVERAFTSALREAFEARTQVKRAVGDVR